MECEAVQLLASGFEIKNEWNCISGFLYGFFFGVDREEFLFTLRLSVDRCITDTWS